MHAQTMYILQKVVEVINSREDISLTPQSVTKRMLSFRRHIIKHTSSREYVHCTCLKTEKQRGKETYTEYILFSEFLKFNRPQYLFY